MSRLHPPAGAVTRRQALALCPALAALAPDPPMRIAFSDSMLAGINPSDARAVLGVWLRRLCQDSGFEIELDSRIFAPAAEIQRRLRAAQLDAVVLNILEYRPVAPLLDPSEILQERHGQDMRYALLVPADSPARRAKDLQGRRITLHEGRTGLLAPHWLRTLTAPDPPERFFSSITTEPKASQVVLPVFFGRLDACITTQRNFQTMAELNPQLLRKLRPIETSPELVITFYAFRKGYRSLHRDRLTASLAGLLATPLGHQIITLFQFSGISLRDVSALKETLALVEAAEKLVLARS